MPKPQPLTDLPRLFPSVDAWVDIMLSGVESAQGAGIALEHLIDHLRGRARHAEKEQ